MTSPARGRPSRRADAGFTLIEVLVVLVVLSLTAALVLGRGPSRSTALDLRAAAGQVVQGLRLARSQAIARNRNVAFVLDVASGGYRIGDAPPRSLPAGLALSITALPRTRPPAGSARLISCRMAAPPAAGSGLRRARGASGSGWIG
jgi:prepilin-type N-terminal cleavage/methylation domain-containing protein